MRIAICQPNMEIQAPKIFPGEIQFTSDEADDALFVLGGQYFPTRSSVEVKNVGVAGTHLIQAKIVRPHPADSLDHLAHDLAVPIPSTCGIL